MRQVINLICLMTAFATLIIGLWTIRKPLAIGDLAFLIWSISPYLGIVFLPKRKLKPLALRLLLGITIFISCGGLYQLVNAMFFIKDAQSGLAFLVIPFAQWFLLLIFLIPVFFLGMTNPIENSKKS
ncbi:hypothetical protein [Xanthovirga aplysinae]|uniref:hypothetical protein n=1 Tax=Xanthovirga aplysinae TaxID=2529853 RepID=UPI0012BB5443|nr:hypothetical protein [Xanthovirga aplysinae]MTI31116.1 hypothetical protein [Xanthovirga aplysinae]